MAYTYIYLDPNVPNNYEFMGYKFDFEPFYVGKGSGDRYLSHLLKAKNTHINLPVLDKIRSIYKSGYTLNNLKKFVVKIEEGIDDSEALLLEKDLIRVIGRRLFDEGPLMNILPGGESAPSMSGSSNPMFNKSWYDQWVIKYGHEEAEIRIQIYKERMSEIVSGRKHKNESKVKISKSIKESWLDEDVRRNRTESVKSYWDNLNDLEYNQRIKNMGNGGHLPSEETRQKMRMSKRGELNHQSRKISVYGKIYISIQECSDMINMNRSTIKNRLLSKNFPEFFFI